VDLGGAALASVLLYTAPAWVAVMGVVWLRERMSPLKLLAVALTLAGVVGIALGGQGEVRLSAGALAWGLVAGLSYALYYPFGKRYFARYAPAAVYVWMMPVGALALWPLVDFAPKSAAAWGALAWIGVVSTYAAYWFYGRGIQRLEPTRAAVVATMEPVVAATLAFALWGERFGVAGYAGAVLILAAVLVSVLERAPAAASRQS
jgi:drug/metabolite transporter, DME family